MVTADQSIPNNSFNWMVIGCVYKVFKSRYIHSVLIVVVQILGFMKWLFSRQYIELNVAGNADLINQRLVLNEMCQNLLCFLYKETLLVFFILCNFTFPLITRAFITKKNYVGFLIHKMKQILKYFIERQPLICEEWYYFILFIQKTIWWLWSDWDPVSYSTCL